MYGVGKAAVDPPALVVLCHKPEGATRTIAWVGKGIVYDTGGLSIKSKVSLQRAEVSDKVCIVRMMTNNDNVESSLPTSILLNIRNLYK